MGQFCGKRFDNFDQAILNKIYVKNPYHFKSFPFHNTCNEHEKYWRCHPLGYDAVQLFEVYGITFHKDELVTAVRKTVKCTCSVYLLS